MAPTIHIVRHAQGLHNVSVENESIRDPDLTPLGEQQCADLRASFPCHARLTKLVASPLRRTIYTCDLSFGGPQPLYPIVLLDTLQEVSSAPCDTGSSKNKLAAEFGDKIDASRVRDNWTDKGKGSIFEPTLEALTVRAKEARRALKEIAEGADGDVAVVSHGGFLHFLTDDWEGIPLERVFGKYRKKGKKAIAKLMQSGKTSATAWKNCECRSYTFAESQDDKDDARLVETEESWRRREHVAKQPLDVTEQRELRAVTLQRAAPYLKINNKA